MKPIAWFTALTLLSTGSVWAEQATPSIGQPTISVSGDYVVNVKPDKVVATLGVQTFDADIMLAKQRNAEALKKAMAVVAQAGVVEKDIQTDQLLIEPRYRESNNFREILGYSVQTMFAITLTETNKVEDLVTKLLQVGANMVQGIDFQVTEAPKYREQARELALKAAWDKAKKMAAVLGQNIGVPVEIREGGSSTQGRSFLSSYGGRNVSTSNGALDVSWESGGNSDSIALGTIAIRANVSVVFSISNP